MWFGDKNLLLRMIGENDKIIQKAFRGTMLCRLQLWKRFKNFDFNTR